MAHLAYLIGGGSPTTAEADLAAKLQAWGHTIAYLPSTTAPAADAATTYGGVVVGLSCTNTVHADWGTLALPAMVVPTGAYLVFKVAGALGSTSTTRTAGYVHTDTDPIAAGVVGEVGSTFAFYTAAATSQNTGNGSTGASLTNLVGINSNASLCILGIYRGALHDGTTGLPKRAIMGFATPGAWTAGAETMVQRMAGELFGGGAPASLSGGAIEEGTVAHNSASLTSAAAASGGTPPYTYAWQRRTGAGAYAVLPGEAGTSLTDATVAASTTYTYRRRVTDSAGSPATAYSNEVTLTTAPVSNVAPMVEIVDAVVSGRTVTLVVAESDSDGSIASAVTDWGDGSTNGEVEHTYAVGGLYTITRTVTDNQGASASAQTEVATLATHTYTARAVVGSQKSAPSAARTLTRPEA